VPLNHGLERNHVFRKVVQLQRRSHQRPKIQLLENTPPDSSQQGNPRTTALLAVAKENGLDIEFVETEPAKGVSTEYLKLNKLGKVPTFEGADGFVLSECIAIAVYCKCPALSSSLARNGMRIFLYSYPCLKTIVENLYSESLLWHCSAIITFGSDSY
jgi:hypothetical protein